MDSSSRGRNVESTTSVAKDECVYKSNDYPGRKSEASLLVVRSRMKSDSP